MTYTPKPTRAQLVRHHFIRLIDMLDFVMPKVGVGWMHIPSRDTLANGLTNPEATDEVDYEACNTGLYVTVEQREYVTRAINRVTHEIASSYVVYENDGDGGTERAVFRIDDQGLQDCVQFLIAAHMWDKVEKAFREKEHYDALQQRKDCY